MAEQQPPATAPVISLDTAALQRTLNVHGRQLTQLLDADPTLGPVVSSMKKNLDYHDYRQRMHDSSEFSNMCKTRRRKVLEFIARGAGVMFSPTQSDPRDNRDVYEAWLQEDSEYYAVMPPIERFMEVPRSVRKERLFDILAEGDLVVGKVCALTPVGGFFVQLQALEPPKSREVWDLNVRGLVQPQDLIVLGDGPLKGYRPEDWVRCEVTAVDISNLKIFLGMKGKRAPESLLHQLSLGKISEKVLIDQLPKSYMHSMECEAGEKYDDLLMRTAAFHNPGAFDALGHQFGIDRTKPTTLMSRTTEFPKDSMRAKLRDRQNQMHGKEFLLKALDLMKKGSETGQARARTEEAILCLDKSIKFHPQADVYVVRGAAYANVGKFTRAIADFKTALAINPDHHNGKKFLVETICAVGKNFVERGQNEDARRAYAQATLLCPDHQPALDALAVLGPPEKRPDEPPPPAAPPASVPEKTPAQIKQEAFEASEEEAAAIAEPLPPVETAVLPPIAVPPPVAVRPPPVRHAPFVPPPNALPFVVKSPVDVEICGLDHTIMSEMLMQICDRYHQSQIISGRWRSGWECFKIRFHPSAVPVNAEDLAIHISNEMKRPIILNGTCIFPMTRNCQLPVPHVAVDFSVPPPPIVAAPPLGYPPPVGIPPIGVPPPPVHAGVPLGVPPPVLTPASAPRAPELEERSCSKSSRTRRSRSRSTSRSSDRKRRRRSRSRSRSRGRRRSRSRGRRRSLSRRRSSSRRCRRSRSRRRTRSRDRGRERKLSRGRRRSRSRSRRRSRSRGKEMKREEQKTYDGVVVRYVNGDDAKSKKAASPSRKRSSSPLESPSPKKTSKKEESHSSSKKKPKEEVNSSPEVKKEGKKVSSKGDDKQKQQARSSSKENHVSKKDRKNRSDEEDDEDLEIDSKKTKDIMAVLSRHVNSSDDGVKMNPKLVSKLLAELTKASKKSKKKKKRKASSSSSSSSSSEEESDSRKKKKKEPKQSKDEWVEITASAPVEVTAPVEVPIPQKVVEVPPPHEKMEEPQVKEQTVETTGEDRSLLVDFIRILNPGEKSKPESKPEKKAEEVRKPPAKLPEPPKLQRKFQEEKKREEPSEPTRRFEEIEEPTLEDLKAMKKHLLEMKEARKLEESKKQQKSQETEGPPFADLKAMKKHLLEMKEARQLEESKKQQMLEETGELPFADLKAMKKHLLEMKEASKLEEMNEKKKNLDVLKEARKKVEQKKREVANHVNPKKTGGPFCAADAREDEEDIAPIFKADEKSKWKPVNAPGKVAPRAPIAITLLQPPAPPTPPPPPPPRPVSPVEIIEEFSTIRRASVSREPDVETTIAGAFARKAKEEAARRSASSRQTSPSRTRDHERRPISRASRSSRSRSRSHSRGRRSRSRSYERRRKRRSRSRSRSRSRERYRGWRSRSRSRSLDRRRRSRSRSRSRSPYRGYRGRGRGYRGRGFRGGF